MNNPFSIFSHWYAEASANAPINPDIVALASATKEGRPSVRMVFYRGIRHGGFSFFTNYESRKGCEFAENPFGAMAFYWPHLGKQIRIEGPVERLSLEESDSYFQSRPFQSQITAVVSRQSRPLQDTSRFHANLIALGDAYSGKPVLRPPNWGGFKLMPEAFEFWTRGEHRRHDRVLYTKEGQGWNVIRLYP